MDISVAAGQSGPLFAPSQRQSQGRSGDGLSVTGRGGGIRRKVVSELAVCQCSGRLASRADALKLGAQKKKNRGEGRGEERSRGRQTAVARWSPVCFEVAAEGRTVRDAASYTPAAVQQTAISSPAGEGRRMQLKVRRIKPSRLDIQGLAEAVVVVGVDGSHCPGSETARTQRRVPGRM